MKFITIINLLLWFAVFKTYSQTDNECVTPRQQRGRCIGLRDCALLFSILRNPPVSQANSLLLRASQCGYEGSIPKVCCPSDATTSPPTTNLLPDTTVCGYSTEPKIFGGQQTNIEEYPWMALLRYELDDGSLHFQCGGALINTRYVLTAAHCAINLRGRELVGVRLGEYDTNTRIDCVTLSSLDRECSDPPVDLPVEEISSFDGTLQRDIALLRLNRNVAYTDFIKPICLFRNPPPNQNYLGRKMTVAGWGVTENGTISNIKRKVTLTIQNNAECIRRYRASRVQVGDGHLCASDVGKDSCRGDSGGPLMISQTSNGIINWYVAGIVSFGSASCGRVGWPGIYTKVDSYVPWILRTVRP